MGAAARCKRGIGRAFQLTNLFPRLSVLENVRLAVQSRAGRGADLWSMWSRDVELIERAEHFLRRVALGERRDALAFTLSHGDQRKLEVAILLALEPEVFMFDEPTAGMSVDEVPVILDLISHICWSSTRWTSFDRSRTALSSCIKGGLSPTARPKR